MHPYHIHFMCKNTKDVQCKKQLHVDGNLLFSHPRGLTGQQHCILTACVTEKGCLIDLLSFPDTDSESASSLLHCHVTEQS